MFHLQTIRTSSPNPHSSPSSLYQSYVISIITTLELSTIAVCTLTGSEIIQTLSKAYLHFVLSRYSRILARHFGMSTWMNSSEIFLDERSWFWVYDGDCKGVEQVLYLILRMRLAWEVTNVGSVILCGAIREFFYCTFLGCDRKIGTATSSFVVSVRPLGTTRLPLYGLSWNLISDDVSKVCQDTFEANWNRTRITCTLHEDCYTGLLKMVVGVSTTCHTQYTWDRSIQLHRWIKKFSKYSFMMRGVQ